MLNKILDRYIFLLCNHTHRGWFQLLSLAIIILPLSLLVILNFNHSYSELTDKAFLKKRNEAQLSSIIIKERLDSLLSLGKIIASRPLVIKYVEEQNWQKATEVLEDVMPTFPYIERVVMYDLKATTKGELPRLGAIGTNRSDYKWYQDFLKNPTPFITGVYYRRIQPRYHIVSAIIPIRDKNRAKVLGILLLQVKLERFSNWISNIDSDVKNELVIIVDNFGKIVYHPKLDLQKQIYDYNSHPSIQKALKGQEGVELIFNPIEKEERLVAYRPISPYGWGMFVSQPADEAFKERKKEIINFILISGTTLSLFTALVISLFLIVLKNKKINTELKAKNSAELANKAKSEFVANISHEIRTPLNSILGFTDYLLESTTNPETKDFLLRINKSGQSLLSLINNILELSKIESGISSLEIKPLNLMSLIYDTTEMLSERAKKKGLELKLEIAPELLNSYILADHLKLQRVLLNLLTNAVKFTQKGEVKLKVIRENTLAPNTNLIFEVHDTGIGIPLEKQALLFKRFSQIDSSTTKKFEGTGLGLSICKEIIELMGGSICVYSAENQGAIFSFKIPFIETNEANSSGHSILQETEITQKKLNILLADDSDENRILIQVYLKKFPYQIDMAINGCEAYEMFIKNQYDIVLMDMQMPEMDGYEATRRIRAWEKMQNQAATPIVALTGFALKEEQEKCLSAGCTFHAAKPIKKATLLEIISSYTRHNDT